MADEIEVIVLREFSNTIFGNVSPGQKMTISRERYRVWAEQGLVKAVNEEAVEDEPEAEPVDDTEEIDFESMDKDELEAFAKERFDIDLDKRRSLPKLREDVQALLEVMNNG